MDVYTYPKKLGLLSYFLQYLIRAEKFDPLTADPYYKTENNKKPQRD